MTLSLLILDVDDVILDMDHLAERAFAACLDPLAAHLPAPLALAVRDDFAGNYATLRAQLRAPAGVILEPAAALLERIGRWQRGVLEAGHQLKQWSRETLLAAALERHGVSVQRALIEAVVRHYWAVLAAQTVMLPDASRLVARARALGATVHLATNSDGTLRYDEAAATFRYDPERSRRVKLDRLARTRDLGLTEDDITVGDPIGKPERAYYEAVLADVRSKLGRLPELGDAVVAGDSLTHDVSPFLELGVGRGAWLLRSRPPGAPQVPPNVVLLGSLDELALESP